MPGFRVGPRTAGAGEGRAQTRRLVCLVMPTVPTASPAFQVSRPQWCGGAGGVPPSPSLLSCPLVPSPCGRTQPSPPPPMCGQLSPPLSRALRLPDTRESPAFTLRPRSCHLFPLVRAAGPCGPTCHPPPPSQDSVQRLSFKTPNFHLPGRALCKPTPQTEKIRKSTLPKRRFATSTVFSH